MQNKFYSYTYWTGEASKPFMVISDDKLCNQDYVVGITANNILVVVNKNNKLIWDGPAPKELRVYSKEVKEFMKDPLYKVKTCKYFGKQSQFSDEEAL